MLQDMKSSGMRTVTMALIVFFAAIILMLPALIDGKIVGDSGNFNIVWSEGFAKALFSGNPYPRWLPDMNRGAGSPVFYFYAPLPFYLTAPFHLFLSPEMAVVAGSCLMLALSGLAFVKLASLFASRYHALVGAVFYMAMPYHLGVDIWHRAAYGEEAAFIFMPLCLAFAFELKMGWRPVVGLGLSFCGLIVSHLLSTLLFAPFLVAMCLAEAWRPRSVQIILRAASAAGLAVALSCVYLLPALTMQSLIQAVYWNIYLPEDFLLFSGKTNGLMALLGLITIAAASASFILAYLSWRAGRLGDFLPWLLIVAATCALVMPFAAPFWHNIAFLQRVQFPFRVFAIMDIALAMLTVLSMARLFTSWKLAALVISVVVAVAFILPMAAGQMDAARSDASQNIRQDTLVLLKTGAPEYLPACWINPDDRYGLASGNNLKYLSEGYPVLGNAPDILKVFYYPFLTAVKDGKALAMACDPQTGFIRFPDGVDSHTVTISAGRPDGERLAFGISLAGLCGFLVLSYATRRANITKARLH